MTLLIAILITIGMLVWIWKIAVKKDRNPWPYLLMSITIPGPIVMLIVMFFLGQGTYALRKAQKAELVSRSTAIKDRG